MEEPPLVRMWQRALHTLGRHWPSRLQKQAGREEEGTEPLEPVLVIRGKTKHSVSVLFWWKVNILKQEIFPFLMCNHLSVQIVKSKDPGWRCVAKPKGKSCYQGWLCSLWGPVQNDNVGPLVQRVPSFTTSTDILSFFLKNYFIFSQCKWMWYQSLSANASRLVFDHF